MCDKNYNHCENQNAESESEMSNEINSDKKKKKKRENKNPQISNSIEEESYNLHVFEQPHSLYPPRPSDAKIQFSPSYSSSKQQPFVPFHPNAQLNLNPSNYYNSNAQITFDPAYSHHSNTDIIPNSFNGRNQNAKVTFNDQQSTLQFSPSFDIASNKKSTPIQRNVSQTPISSTFSTQNQTAFSTQNQTKSIPAHNQTIVTIEPTPNSHASESDETLC